MTDIHCHILPGVDDGSVSLECSLHMARIAAASGIREICATPHLRFATADENEELLSLFPSRFEELKNAAKKEGIPITFYRGAEVLCSPQVIPLLSSGALPTLGGTQYLLCEFLFDDTLSYMDDMLARVKAEGYIPVVAHPERYGAIQEDPRTLARWFSYGYIVQINKGTILGSFGRAAARCALWILDAGLAHVIASDAHSPDARTPDVTKLFDFLSEQIDSEYVRILTERNPARILRGREVVPV